MGTVTNTEYEKALENIDYQKIMHSASAKYMTYIEELELENCRLIGLWRALEDFDPERQVKFTSYLYDRVKYECKKTITKNKKTEIVHSGLIANAIDKNNYQESVDIVDGIENSLGPELQNLVEKKYFQGMTYEDIADSEDYSHETVRRRVNKAINILRNTFKNDF